MIAPTPRAAALFALSPPLALVAAAYDPAWTVLAVAGALTVLFAIAADALLAPSPGRMRVAVLSPGRLGVGETGDVSATIAAPRRAALDLALERRGDPDPAPTARLLVEPGVDARARLPLTPRRRGQVHLDALWLRWSGPLGLARFIRRVAIGAAVDVVPNVRGGGGALRVLQRDALHGLKAQTMRGEGTEFEALRDYAPGHDPRHVDWKRSAHHRKLVAKEFQTERNHHVVLAFDTGRLMRETIGGIARLDHAINSGLALASIALRGGDLVGLYGFDAAPRAWTAPVRGLGGLARLQRATASLAYRPDEANYTLGLAELGSRLRRRALVVLFTEFTDTITAELMIESLGRVAARHVVVLVTLRDGGLEQALDAEPRAFETVAEAVIAEQFRRDRGVVFERLARLGLHPLDVAPGGLSPALVNRYVSIKTKGLL